MTLRQTMGEIFDEVPEDVVVATSGGIDSSSIVVTAMDRGKQVTCMSFTLDDRESEDFLAAKKLANYFGLPFIPVIMPTDEDVIDQTVCDIIRTYDTSKKTTIECLVPYVFLFQQMHAEGHKTMLNGTGADGHFALSNKAMIHYRSTKELYQQYRSEFFSRPNISQTVERTAMGAELGILVVTPYADSRVFPLFSDMSWDEANKPRQKEAIRREFPELDPLSIRKHTNLQLGDSGIAELIGRVIKERYAPESKSVISAYNRMKALAQAGQL